MNDYLEKLRTIATIPRPSTKSEKVERTDKSIIRTTEHDGIVDTAVTPDTVRYNGRVHKTGKKRGEIAEVNQSR